MLHTIEIATFAFDPAEIEISSGDTIKWINRDGTRHSAKRTIAPAFDTGLLSRDEQSEGVTIEASAGETLKYFCDPHPHMIGTLKVVD
jgi:plastocyanin